jgi:hypothetical protein
LTVICEGFIATQLYSGQCWYVSQELSYAVSAARHLSCCDGLEGGKPRTFNPKGASRLHSPVHRQDFGTPSPPPPQSLQNSTSKISPGNTRITPQLHAAHPPQWVSVHRKSSLHPPLTPSKPTSLPYQTSSYQLSSPTNANNISPAAPSSPTTQTTQPGPATPPASATGSSPRKAGPPAARSAPPPRRTHRTTRPPAHRTSACC